MAEAFAPTNCPCAGACYFLLLLFCCFAEAIKTQKSAQRDIFVSNAKDLQAKTGGLFSTRAKSARRAASTPGNQAADALVFSPLRRATLFSLVLAAFSSLRFVVSNFTISSLPLASTHAIRVP